MARAKKKLRPKILDPDDPVNEALELLEKHENKEWTDMRHTLEFAYLLISGIEIEEFHDFFANMIIKVVYDYLDEGKIDFDELTILSQFSQTQIIGLGTSYLSMLIKNEPNKKTKKQKA